LINDDADYRNIVVTYLTFPDSNRRQSAYRRKVILRQAQAYARANPDAATQLAAQIGFFRPATPEEPRNVSGEMARWVNELATRHMQKSTGATIVGAAVARTHPAWWVILGLVLLFVSGFTVFVIYKIRRMNMKPRA
jgi:hypothetical protein